MFDLIVVNSFDKYAKGDRLSGDADMLAALAEKYPHNVIRITRSTDKDAAALVTHMLAKPSASAAPSE